MDIGKDSDRLGRTCGPKQTTCKNDAEEQTVTYHPSSPDNDRIGTDVLLCDGLDCHNIKGGSTDIDPGKYIVWSKDTRQKRHGTAILIEWSGCQICHITRKVQTVYDASRTEEKQRGA